jgi:hypothetical protein
MLDISRVLERLIGIRGLEADLKPLRAPCTCAAGEPECPACHAWGKRHPNHRLRSVAHIYPKPPVARHHRLLSVAEFVRLERRILYDTENLRALRQKEYQHGPLSRTDEDERRETIKALKEARAVRDAHLQAVREGAAHGTRLPD